MLTAEIGEPLVDDHPHEITGGEAHGEGAHGISRELQLYGLAHLQLD